jgi:uncharacterized protein (DUF2225 family)
MFNPLKAYLLKRFYLYVLGQKSSRLGLNSFEISWIKKKKKKAKEIKFYLYLALLSVKESSQPNNLNC